MSLFDDVQRTDRAPRKANESRYDFYNRSASAHTQLVRDLLDTWFGDIPDVHRQGIRGQITSGENHDFDSAFWEMYLFKVTTGSGCDVELHPEMEGTNRRPDFLVHADRPFYLEAIAVGQRPETRASSGRLKDVEAVLDQVHVDGFTLRFSWFEIGAEPLKAKKLRTKLLNWVASLDRDAVLVVARRTGELPDEARFAYSEPGDDVYLETPLAPDGTRAPRWVLEFTALPVHVGGSPLLGIRGPGRAGGSNNRSGLRRALDKKANRYGKELSYPLVIAVLSNTSPPIRDYDIQPELYGETAGSPTRAHDHEELYADGHWRTKTGWRRSHAPHVITGAGIDIFSMVREVPRLWTTVEPDVSGIGELAWADSVDVTGTDPSKPSRQPDLAALGIPSNWMSAGPDFDV